jgi:hypothetical protein
MSANKRSQKLPLVGAIHNLRTREPESGNQNPESGIRKPESGIRKPESGNRNPETESGNGIRKRNPETESGNRNRKPESETGIGNRNRKPESGKQLTLTQVQCGQMPHTYCQAVVVPTRVSNVDNYRQSLWKKVCLSKSWVTSYKFQNRLQVC